ncbi:unnamed protein product [Ectocarpus sp. 8 AP-2014]
MVYCCMNFSNGTSEYQPKINRRRVEKIKHLKRTDFKTRHARTRRRNAVSTQSCLPTSTHCFYTGSTLATLKVESNPSSQKTKKKLTQHAILPKNENKTRTQHAMHATKYVNID